ncbi:MAG: hypothetical protein ACRDNB_06840 [Gaiellaceae bacterium]
MRSRSRTAFALLVAAAIAAASGGAALIGLLWGFGLQCDDTCGEPPPWRDDPEAWQWSALGWIGIASLACSAVLLFLLPGRRRIPTAVAGATWVGLGAAFIVLLDQSGLTSNAHRSWIGLAVATVAIGAVAATTTPRRS